MARFDFDPDSMGIVVYANFKRKDVKTARMVLDTGASFTTIPWHLAQALGYQPAISKEWATITTADGLINAPLIDIDVVDVFGMEAYHITTMVHDLPETSRVDGLLGLSYLKHFKLTLDFKQGILELE